jgi:hypothetical protein
MLAMLLAYDDAGNVIATLDYVVARDDAGAVVGLIDFAQHEENGGAMTDVATFDSGDPAHPVKGAKVWPEWLGMQAHDFRVELVGPPGAKTIGALVHKTSGYRRERTAIASAIQARVDAAKGAPADIRDLVGGPDRPLALAPDGRTAPRVARRTSTLPVLPSVRGRPQAE